MNHLSHSAAVYLPTAFLSTGLGFLLRLSWRRVNAPIEKKKVRDAFLQKNKKQKTFSRIRCCVVGFLVANLCTFTHISFSVDWNVNRVLFQFNSWRREWAQPPVHQSVKSRRMSLKAAIVSPAQPLRVPFASKFFSGHAHTGFRWLLIGWLQRLSNMKGNKNKRLFFKKQIIILLYKTISITSKTKNNK